MVTLLPIADVSEGNITQVCVRLSSQTAQTVEFNLEVTLPSGPPSYHGLFIIIYSTVIGKDFTLPNDTSVVFSGDNVGSVRCVGIMTNPDMIVEGDQQFPVSLVLTNAQSSDIVLIDTPSL